MLKTYHELEHPSLQVGIYSALFSGETITKFMKHTPTLYIFESPKYITKI